MKHAFKYFFSHEQSLKSSVKEVIDAIDTQLSKQEDIHKKKVCYGANWCYGCTVFCKIHSCSVCPHCQ